MICLALHWSVPVRQATLRLLDRVADTGALHSSRYVSTLVAAQIDPDEGARRAARVLLSHHVTGQDNDRFRGYFDNAIGESVEKMYRFYASAPPARRSVRGHERCPGALQSPALLLCLRPALLLRLFLPPSPPPRRRLPRARASPWRTRWCARAARTGTSTWTVRRGARPRPARRRGRPHGGEWKWKTDSVLCGPL